MFAGTCTQYRDMNVNRGGFEFESHGTEKLPPVTMMRKPMFYDQNGQCVSGIRSRPRPDWRPDSSFGYHQQQHQPTGTGRPLRDMASVPVNATSGRETLPIKHNNSGIPTRNYIEDIPTRNYIEGIPTRNYTEGNHTRNRSVDLAIASTECRNPGVANRKSHGIPQERSCGVSIGQHHSSYHPTQRGAYVTASDSMAEDAWLATPSRDAPSPPTSGETPFVLSNYQDEGGQDMSSVSSPTKTNLPPLPPCRICGAKASGFHYGVNSCEACKGFFRRALKCPVLFHCTKENACSIKRNNRSACRFCRYQRCLSLGMSRDAIKTGRYSHKKRTSDIIEVKQLESKTRFPVDAEPECDNVLDVIMAAHRAQRNQLSASQTPGSIRDMQRKYLGLDVSSEDRVGKPAGSSSSILKSILQNDNSGELGRSPCFSDDRAAVSSAEDDATSSTAIRRHSIINTSATDSSINSSLGITTTTTITTSTSSPMVASIDGNTNAEEGTLANSKSYSNSCTKAYPPTSREEDTYYSTNADGACSSSSVGGVASPGVASPSSLTSNSNDSGYGDDGSSSSEETDKSVMPVLVSDGALDLSYNGKMHNEHIAACHGVQQGCDIAGAPFRLQEVVRVQHPSDFTDSLLKTSSSSPISSDPEEDFDNDFMTVDLANADTSLPQSNGGRLKRKFSETVMHVADGPDMKRIKTEITNDDNTTTTTMEDSEMQFPNSYLIEEVDRSRSGRCEKAKQACDNCDANDAGCDRKPDVTSSKASIRADNLRMAESWVKGYIRFANSIPGFTEIPSEARCVLLRQAWDEVWMLQAHSGFNSSLNVAVMPSGLCLDMKHMCSLWGEDYTCVAFDVAHLLQRYCVGQDETTMVMLKALCILAPDRCPPSARAKVEQIHWFLVSNLLKFIQGQASTITTAASSSITTPLTEADHNHDNDNHDNKDESASRVQSFPHLVSVLTALRDFSESAQRHEKAGLLGLDIDESFGSAIFPDAR